MTQTTPLYDDHGKRLYLTAAERDAFREAAIKEERPVRLFCHLLYYAGPRISEALQITPRRIDLSNQTIIFETLKRRRKGVFRAVPVPPSLLDDISLVYGIREIQQSGRDRQLDARLWTWDRTTAWRKVTAVMTAAGIESGPHRNAKGLRHGYAIHALNSNVPLNMVSKWLGHSKMETTAIYANAVGEEQQAIAARMWSTG